jgi:hypothetical protein
MSKAKLKWSDKAEEKDFGAALSYLTLLASSAKAEPLVRSLRSAKPTEHAAKDLLRAAGLLPMLAKTLSGSIRRSRCRLCCSFAGI